MERGRRKAETTSKVSSLGSRLRQARDLRQQSISIIAKKAGISSAYLQKLEVGDVHQPSPNVLHVLSNALEIDYGELMRLAGYVVPNAGTSKQRRRNELTYALSSEELTDEEGQVLAEYLNWFRSRRRQGAS